jgi:hypothetical protein
MTDAGRLRVLQIACGRSLHGEPMLYALTEDGHVWRREWEDDWYEEPPIPARPATRIHPPPRDAADAAERSER